MGGKSTLMRQTAVLAILAHVVSLYFDIYYYNEKENMLFQDIQSFLEKFKHNLTFSKKSCLLFFLGKLCTSNVMRNECM